MKLIKDLSNENINNYNSSSIVRISSYASFVDPELIEEVAFNKTANFDEALKDVGNPEETMSSLKEVVKLFGSFNKKSVILNMRIGDNKISSSLNRDYLYITIEQFRSTYISTPSTYVTLIGHLIKKDAHRINNESMVENINLNDLMSTITGTIDFTIEPLAIYA